MNEYRAAVPKGEITGYAQDPNQEMANSGGIELNNPLTTKNAIGLAATVAYGKKIGGLIYNASIDQIGDGRVEVASIIGQKVLTGVGLGLATGGLGVALYVGYEVASTGLDYVIDGHKINLENEEKLATRGTRRNYGVGYYD